MAASASGDRIGIFGGTFDPPHIGHLIVAEAAADQLRLDRVVFVPAGVPYHKTGTSSDEHRLRMTELAAAGNSRFEVSPYDVTRVGPTYTVDTLRGHAGHEPGDETFFIAGSDVLPQLHTWKDIDECFALAHFAVSVRNNHLPAVSPGVRTDRIVLFDAPATGISSSEVRRLAAAGLSLRYLVPDAVIDYIRDKRLYQPGQ